MALSSSRLACGMNETTSRVVADASMSELDPFLGELTHAVLNALNTINAGSELAALLIGRRAPVEAAEPLTRIESECMRAARLLRDGRAFMTFRIAQARGGVDVVALMEACAGTFDGRVAVDGGRALPLLAGDADALRRAFMEILGNAFQFGAKHVHVVLQNVDAGRVVRIGFHDDGPGITASAARIFEPFFSTLPGEHSGLGLALAARIAKAHGGSLGVDAAEKGASFWMELPLGSD